MIHWLIRYRDNQDNEGYALLASVFDLPGGASLIAFDPKRGVSVRTRTLVEMEPILDVSRPCQRDRRTVLKLIAGMPDTLEKLQILNTVCDI